MIQGAEIHSIIEKIFGEVRGGLYHNPQLRVDCPICKDGKFNLEINTAKGSGVFHCWKCDPKFSGSLKKLIRRYGSSADYEIFKSYAGIFVDYKKEEEFDSFVYLPKEMILFSKINTENSQHLIPYSYMILERKISIEVLKKYRVGFCIEGRYAGRIIIPSYDSEGFLNYFVARAYLDNIKPKYLNPKVDKNKIIFNEGYINWDSLVILVEGIFDAFSLPNAIPLLGKIISSKLLFKLKEKKPNIIVCLDPDAKEQNITLTLLLKNIYQSEESKVKLIDLGGEDDIDKLRVNNGNNFVIEKLYQARNLSIDDYFIFKKYKAYDKRKRREYTY